VRLRQRDTQPIGLAGAEADVRRQNCVSSSTMTMSPRGMIADGVKAEGFP